jgi:dihydroorotate dehydrogenase (fumarate)
MSPLRDTTPDLSCTIAGVRFPLCIMNASGALCVTREELDALGRSSAGAIVTKSMTLEPRDGNPEPRYFPFSPSDQFVRARLPADSHVNTASINSMGLPNLGYQAYAELIPALKTFKKPVIASIAGLCEDDFPEIARTISKAGPDLIEVNLSCPNIPGKPQIGYDFEASERLIRKVRAVVDRPMGVKLPPYFDPAHHAAMAEVLKRAPVDFLSLINSVGNALVIDPERETVMIKPKGGFGGLGGSVIKAVALANVRAFWKALDGRIPIIGVGGVMSGTDVFEHLLAGATAVQVGTALVEEGTGVFERLAAELRAVLIKKKYLSSSAVVGRLKEL